MSKGVQEVHEQVITKWANWVLRDADLEIKDLQKDFSDSFVLLNLVKQLNPEFKNIKIEKNKKKENMNRALGFLNKKLGVSLKAQDFQGGDVNKLHQAFWGMMQHYRKLHFDALSDPKFNAINGKEDSDDFLSFQNDLNLYISRELIGRCWVISASKAPVPFERDEKDPHSRYPFKSSDCYCFVGVTQVKDEKENPTIFVRLGKESQDKDRNEALKYAQSLIERMGKNNLIVVAEEGNETPEFFKYTDVSVTCNDTDLELYRVKKADTMEVEKAEAEEILNKGELVIPEKQVYLLRNSQEVIFISSHKHPLDIERVIPQWNLIGNKFMSYTICHDQDAPLRVFTTLKNLSQRRQSSEEGKKREEEEGRKKVDEKVSKQEKVKIIRQDLLKPERLQLPKQTQNEQSVEDQQSNSKGVHQVKVEQEKQSERSTTNPRPKFEERTKRVEEERRKNVDSSSHIKLPIVCREGKEGLFTIETGTAGLDLEKISPAKLLGLWYGFTSMSWEQFSPNKEACSWENYYRNFCHERYIPINYKKGQSEEIRVDVPKNKNVVFRLQFERNGIEESQVYFSEVK